jgi:hypothetical protein
MSSGTNEHERRACSSAVRWLSRLTGIEFGSVEWARDNDSASANVEGVYRGPDGSRLSVEHTLIEAYPRQISKDKRFLRLTPRLEAITFAEVPASFIVRFPISYDEQFSSAADDAPFVAALKSELNTLASVMQHRESREVEVWSIPIRVTRSDRHTMPVWAVRGWPESRALTAVIRERLIRKAAKFNDQTGRRLLVLEVASITLEMGQVIESAGQCEQELGEYDDVIVLETDNGQGPWFAYALRMGGQAPPPGARPQEIPIIDARI